MAMKGMPFQLAKGGSSKANPGTGPSYSKKEAADKAEDKKDNGKPDMAKLRAGGKKASAEKADIKEDAKERSMKSKSK